VVAEAGREILDDAPQGTADAGRQLRERWPDREHTVLGNVLRDKLALVQLPPRGLWHSSGRAVCTTVENWLGRPQQAVDRRELVLRYLGAFGPAAVVDAPPPVRLLPEFDDVLLAHADRRRVIADDRLGVVVGGKPTVLVDGYVAATRAITKERTITVDHLDRLPMSRQKAVAEECDRLQDWMRI